MFLYKQAIRRVNKIPRILFKAIKGPTNIKEVKLWICVEVSLFIQSWKSTSEDVALLLKCRPPNYTVHLLKQGLVTSEKAVKGSYIWKVLIWKKKNRHANAAAWQQQLSRNTRRRARRCKWLAPFVPQALLFYYCLINTHNKMLNPTIM